MLDDHAHDAAVALDLPNDDAGRRRTSIYQPEQAGLIAVEVRVVQAPANETEAIILSMKEREALALLYAWANEFKLLLLLRPAGG